MYQRGEAKEQQAEDDLHAWDEAFLGLRWKEAEEALLQAEASVSGPKERRHAEAPDAARSRAAATKRIEGSWSKASRASAVSQARDGGPVEPRLVGVLPRVHQGRKDSHAWEQGWDRCKALQPAPSPPKSRVRAPWKDWPPAHLLQEHLCQAARAQSAPCRGQQEGTQTHIPGVIPD